MSKQSFLGVVGLAMLTFTSLTASAAEVRLRDDIQWEPLNPLRGDKSPQAAPLWGGLKSTVSTAFLVKFRDGFSSPPHIHNVTYRGVVISGLVHNDDPKAATMWMPAGSFWTQPAGEDHITSAQGEINVAYIEIDQGPYLVRPSTEAFDTGERPINMEKSNFVWLDASDVSWVDEGGAQVAFLWGDRKVGEFNGTMIKLPAGFKGTLESEGEIFRGVLIQGQATYEGDGVEGAQSLTAGSYFGSKGSESHSLVAQEDGESLIYVRTNGKIKVTSR